MLRWKDLAPVLHMLRVNPGPGEPSFENRAGFVPAESDGFSGTLEGKRVEIVLEGEAVIVAVPVWPALDLGLVLEPETFLSWPKLPTDNREFDERFTVLADEPPRAAELLAGPVLDAFVALGWSGVRVSMRDNVIRLAGHGTIWLETAVPRVVQIARLLDEQRPRVRAAAPLAGCRPALGRFASDHLLRIDDNPVRLSGTYDDVRVQVVFVREALRRFGMNASLHLDASLNLDLRIEPARFLTSIAALLPGQADHRLGDGAFDAALRVRTSRPELVTRLFDSALRRALLSCSSAAQSLLLDDDGLTIEMLVADGPPTPAEILQAGLAVVTGLVRGVRAAPPAVPNGPFR